MASKGKVSMANTDKWYGDAKQYWEDVPATVDGMLGGLAHVSCPDIEGSRMFLQGFLQEPNALLKSDCVLDCGCGIGRVTKHLLLPLFKKVDMVEQNKKFLDQAQEYLGEEEFQRVERLICSGLQDFSPEKSRYNVIWIQWVLSHLTDVHLVEFLNRCQSGLVEDGIIIVKENVSRTKCIVDDDDSSITRTDKKYKNLFKKAGMNIIKEDVQKNLPKNLFKVKMQHKPGMNVNVNDALGSLSGSLLGDGALPVPRPVVCTTSNHDLVMIDSDLQISSLSTNSPILKFISNLNLTPTGEMDIVSLK